MSRPAALYALLFALLVSVASAHPQHESKHVAPDTAATPETMASADTMVQPNDRKMHVVGWGWPLNDARWTSRPPNDEYRDDHAMEMIWVEPGTFVMGSPESEKGRDAHENQHEVSLTRGFYLGKYEVTQPTYNWVMGENPSRTWGRNLPVGNVSWLDAVAFCERLTEIEKEAGRLPEGMVFMLPTEAEWEYACRAGTTTAYWWGDEITPDNACHGGPNGTMLAGTPEPVGQYAPNPWGFHDMHGNVYEWCNDTASYPEPTIAASSVPASEWTRHERVTLKYAFREGKPTIELPSHDYTGIIPSQMFSAYSRDPVTDPTGPAGKTVFYMIRDGKVVRMPPSTIDPKKPSILKVMRGGSHMSSYAHVRSAYRHAHQAWQRIPYKGFRVALKTFSASHEREWDRD